MEVCVRGEKRIIRRERLSKIKNLNNQSTEVTESQRVTVG